MVRGIAANHIYKRPVRSPKFTTVFAVKKEVWRKLCSTSSRAYIVRLRVPMACMIGAAGLLARDSVEDTGQPCRKIDIGALFCEKFHTQPQSRH